MRVDDIKAKGSGGVTPIEDMLFFAHIDLKQGCYWKIIGDGKFKTIVFEVAQTKKEPNNY